MPSSDHEQRSFGDRRCPRHRGLAAALTLTIALTAMSCAPSATTGSVASSTATTAPKGPTTYTTIDELQKALEVSGIPCKLSYPGLKDDTNNGELSICVVDDEQAFLKIWFDPNQIKKFVASPDGQTGTVAVGANWTITVQTNKVAEKLAKAAGGTAPSGAVAISTTIR